MIWLKAILDIYNWPARSMAILGMASGALLAISISSRQWLPNVQISSEVIVLFLVTFSLCVAYFIAVAIYSRVDAYNDRRDAAAIRKRWEIKLAALTEPERAVLREFYFRREVLLHLPSMDPAVKSLEHRQILEFVGPYSISKNGFPRDTAIRDEVRDYLSLRALVPPEYLTANDNGRLEPTQNGRFWIEEYRPEFIKNPKSLVDEEEYDDPCNWD